MKRTSKQSPTDSHTSERTSLGYVLQLLVEEALKRAHVSFLPNLTYHDNFIQPDVLIPGNPPLFSIHVTCTGADNSFQMKRWRYVDEVLQMRSVWGDHFAAVNIMFGSVDGYQSGDKKLLERLFDYAIVVDELPQGQYLYSRAIYSVANAQADSTSRQISRQLILDHRVSMVIEEIGRRIKRLIDSTAKAKITAEDVAPLTNLLRKRKRGLVSDSFAPTDEAFWKRTMLRFLAVSPDYWNEVFALAIKPQNALALSPQLSSAGLRAKLITKHVGLVSTIKCNPETIATIRAGLDVKLLVSLKDRVENDPRRKYELRDLWDDGKRARTAVKEVVEAIAKGRSAVEDLVEYSIKNGGSPKVDHHRAHVLDVINVALGWSQNKLQEAYQGPSIGVVDPIRNLIPRTELCLQVLRQNPNFAGRVSRAIVNSIIDRVNGIDQSSVEVVTDKYLNYRVYCLVKGSSIDPLEDYIKDTCFQRGWSIQSPGITCAHPLLGRMKTVFTVAAIKGDKKLLVKCLFGDTGSDHKAEEMEARMRIIRTTSNEWSNCTSVFVADGKWSKGQLTALYLGGWDKLVAVATFDKCLRSL